MPESATPKPSIDLAEELRRLMGRTGGLNEAMGGYRIQVHDALAFPWDAVFNALLSRDFKVYVTRRKADLFIEATP